MENQVKNMPPQQSSLICASVRATLEISHFTYCSLFNPNLHLTIWPSDYLTICYIMSLSAEASSFRTAQGGHNMLLMWPASPVIKSKDYRIHQDLSKDYRIHQDLSKDYWIHQDLSTFVSDIPTKVFCILMRKPGG